MIRMEQQKIRLHLFVPLRPAGRIFLSVLFFQILKWLKRSLEWTDDKKINCEVCAMACQSRVLRPISSVAWDLHGPVAHVTIITFPVITPAQLCFFSLGRICPLVLKLFRWNYYEQNIACYWTKEEMWTRSTVQMI